MINFSIIILLLLQKFVEYRLMIPTKGEFSLLYMPIKIIIHLYFYVKQIKLAIIYHC